MTTKKETAERQRASADDSGKARRPYAPAAIEEEVAIENVAMTCNATGHCGTPSTS